jgi:hypothetical protein
MKRLRIGIFPLSEDLRHPGDRRRLASWAKSRGHSLQINDPRNADVLFLSEGSDFLALSKLKSVPKIFDLIDGYLVPQGARQDFMRGTAKSLLLKHQTYPRRYTSIVAEACRNVDLVVCSSIEQQVTIMKHNKNTRIILDNHSEIPLVNFTSRESRSHSPLFWEGTTFTLSGLEKLMYQFSTTNTPVNLVTDEYHFKLLGKYFPQSVRERLDTTIGKNRYQLHSWSIENLVRVAMSSGVAVLPVETADNLQAMKPENRLLIMYRLGLPCLTSPIPSYKRVESVLKIGTTCDSPYEWIKKWSDICNDENFAEYHVLKGQQYLRDFHSEELINAKWDEAVSSLV